MVCDGIVPTFILLLIVISILIQGANYADAADLKKDASKSPVDFSLVPSEKRCKTYAAGSPKAAASIPASGNGSG
jgi:hypothetical protein